MKKLLIYTDIDMLWSKYYSFCAL